ncbi:hypothetical protein HPQ64_17320 [Rhizobiales bacterium]|uniref:hypothetical protein n=1 Tax=Hongsoonwoonella zoysiae TaxID=2821844 RepID=UPI0015612EDF|nr:hypothetical protein [Hongsoonwoonella zoysiae]NRG19456.1 hypothetical protein [Hongsoonwoonella zoysiae]
MSDLAEKKTMAPGLISRLRRLLSGKAKPRRAMIDPRSAPDHLKRDLGMLDGRGNGIRRK